MEKMIEKLKQNKDKILLGGGEKQILRQKKKGKHTARERIDLLVDKNSFREQDMFMKEFNNSSLACDAVVVGRGLIDDRPIYMFSQDATIMGGSVGGIHAKKICTMLDKAQQVGAPVIGINDSVGARIQDQGITGYTYVDIFYRNTLLSGYIPQISIILGPCAGGAVYSPALTDFVFMVRGTSLMFITGPDVIRTVTGEEVTVESLGSSNVHSAVTGVAHFVAENEEECMEMVRKLLSYLPSNCTQKPPRAVSNDRPDRISNSIKEIIPVDPAISYDVRNLIEEIVDIGSFLEVHSQFAQNICVGFARMDGETVGIVANQPDKLAGCLDINASVKAARFVRFCDGFNIPLLTFVDCPGYLPGTNQEYGAIIRHGSKLLYAFSEATVPKITIIVRKAYGGAYAAMCGNGLGTDFVLALPTAVMGIMGPEAAVKLLYGDMIAKSENPGETKAKLINEFKEKFSSPYPAAEYGIINDIVDPSFLRPYLINLLESHKTSKKTIPPKKHGNIPL